MVVTKYTTCFKIKILSSMPIYHICVLLMPKTTNSNYFPTHHNKMVFVIKMQCIFCKK